MIRGLYSAASGMVAMEKRMEIATTNLANVQTNGFKQDRNGISTFAEQLVSRLTADQGSVPIGPLSISGVAESPQTDWSQGSLQSTGRELDLGISGAGFFTIQTPDGIRYTRNGSFTRDAQGVLTTSTGRALMGQSGPIQVPYGTVSVDLDGTISVDGVVVDQLQLVEFDELVDIRRFGNNELGPSDPAVQPRAATSTSVQQGFVESSNVDVTATMTTIMEIQRAYEANQRMIQATNELTGRAVNEIARPTA